MCLLSKDLFSWWLHNGESVTQHWLHYSPSSGSVYFFACKFLSIKMHAFIEGFSDWKHTECLSEHEKSLENRNCMLAWIWHAKATGTVDAGLPQQFHAGCQYWREVLKRV